MDTATRSDRSSSLWHALNHALLTLRRVSVVDMSLLPGMMVDGEDRWEVEGEETRDQPADDEKTCAWTACCVLRVQILRACRVMKNFVTSSDVVDTVVRVSEFTLLADCVTPLIVAWVLYIAFGLGRFGNTGPSHRSLTFTHTYNEK